MVSQELVQAEIDEYVSMKLPDDSVEKDSVNTKTIIGKIHDGIIFITKAALFENIKVENKKALQKSLDDYHRGYLEGINAFNVKKTNKKINGLLISIISCDAIRKGMDVKIWNVVFYLKNYHYNVLFLIPKKDNGNKYEKSVRKMLGSIKFNKNLSVKDQLNIP